MSKERAEELIRKYLEGTATPEEEALLESWYTEAAQNQLESPAAPDYPKIGEEILQLLRAEQEGQVIPVQPKSNSPVRLWPSIAAAAAVIVLLWVGSYLLYHKDPMPSIVKRPAQETDILPAAAKATLTLVDGQTIQIDSAGGGTLPRQGNARIETLNGQLIYSISRPDPQTPKTNGVAYNTLTTKPGEHYSLLLQDGTKAWLNAASSITYPVVFDGDKRQVKVTGEVYFEIAHNDKQPFSIAVRNELIEDIGTHLNINAYDNEPAINTTLLEGRINVSNGSSSTILRPGQQATLAPGEETFHVKTVDADKAVAWKDGYFYFDRADIETVMRQLARWYNIQVAYQGEIPKRTFKGKVYRNINASEALQILSYFGAHFKIDGKTITVTF